LKLTQNSSRDIQKKLKDLLPRDYTKEYRHYRPKDEHSTSLRFNRLLKSEERQSRDDQRRELSQSERSNTQISNHLDSSDPAHLFEGPSWAFRNYAKDTEIGAFLSARAYLIEAGEKVGSQLVDPSRLLLDGSSIEPTIIDSCIKHSNRATPVSIRLGCNAPSRESSIPSAPPKNIAMLPLRDSLSRMASTISLNSVEERLGRRTTAVARHVCSVLRYSSSSSLSTVSSWRSSRSSLWNFTLPQKNSESVIPSTDSSESRQEEEHHPCRLSKSEQLQLIWDETIDGSRLDQSSIQRPTSDPRLTKRTCCFEYRTNSGDGSDEDMCSFCGKCHIHLLAQSPKNLEKIAANFQQQINRKDYLDNGPLHFAAKSGVKNPKALLDFIKSGADALAKNTCGQTFLHMLFQNVGLRHVPQLFGLLRYLESLNFPFSSRDHHGRLPCHILLEAMHLANNERDISVDLLVELFYILKPDIDSMDNAGHSIRSYILAPSGGPSKCQHEMILSRYPISHNAEVDFQGTLGEMSGGWTEYWKEWLAVEGRSTWIDRGGDTAMTALLKCWSYDSDELLLQDIIRKMVELGCQIDMRDRVGRTSLAIAVCRGLRPAVVTLLDLGASMRTRTYRGTSIYALAKKRCRWARRNRFDKIYAMIWSCRLALLDHGKEIRHEGCSEYLEWMVASWKPPADYMVHEMLAESGFL